MPEQNEPSPEVLAERERCRTILMKALIHFTKRDVEAAERAISRGTPADEFQVGQ